MVSNPLPESRGRLAFDGTKTPVKTALFLLVCAAWLLPGLVGHDPWKVEEALVFGVATEMLRTGDWIVTRIAGESWLGNAPLAYWAAALSGKAFGSLLPLHDAMRLSAGLFMAATLGFLLLAARELLGDRAMRASVLLFMGCLGILIRAHEMSTDLAGLSGIALCLYGLALARRLPRVGGAVTGLGLGLAFLGDGFLPLALLAALMAVLPLAGAAWRTRTYAMTVAIALACAAPVTGLWFALLASSSEATLWAWIARASASRWSEGGSRAGAADLIYFARILPWYAWPAWPLAAWTLWRARRDLASRDDLLLPFAALLVFFVVLSAFGEAREMNAMPLLLPLALLGVAEIDSLRRGAASALDWFGVTTFFLLAAVLWLLWIAAMTGRPEGLAHWIAQEAPGPRPDFRFLGFAFSTLLTLLWLAVVARSLRSARRALVNWTAGIAMVWLLAMTLGLQLIDRVRSYRGVSQQMIQMLPVGYRCAVGENIGEAQRALLFHYAGLRFYRPDDPRARACAVRLVQTPPGLEPAQAPGWTEIWRGSRPGDKRERFILYQRPAAAAPGSRAPA